MESYVVFCDWLLSLSIMCSRYLHMVASTSFLFYAAAAKSLQSCPTLCDPIDGSPPGSAVPGILQATTLEWVVISFSSAGKWKVKSESEDAQSYPTLRDPMDCSLPGSSIHRITGAQLKFSLFLLNLLQFFSIKIFEEILHFFNPLYNPKQSFWLPKF